MPKDGSEIYRGEPFELDTLLDFTSWHFDGETSEAVIYCKNNRSFRFFDEYELVRFSEADTMNLYKSDLLTLEDPAQGKHKLKF